MGILAGFLACKLTNKEGKGCLLNLLLGIVGGAVGEWVFSLLGIYTASFAGELFTATIGAALVLWIWNKLF